MEEMNQAGNKEFFEEQVIALKDELLKSYEHFEKKARNILSDEIKSRYQMRQEIASLYIAEVDSKIAGTLIEEDGVVCFKIPASFNPLLEGLDKDEKLEKSRDIKKTLDDFLSTEIRNRVTNSTRENKHPFERLDQPGKMINGLGVVEGNYPLHLSSLDDGSVHRLITADTSIMTHGFNDDQRFVFVSVMDVSGKLKSGGDYLGLLTKLYATSILHNSEYNLAHDVCAPDKFFGLMNQLLSSRFRYQEHSDKFVASTALLIDQRGQSIFGDAGGMHPIHLRYNPETISYSANLLDSLEEAHHELNHALDLPLGAFQDTSYSSKVPLNIKTKDFIVLYTDGVTEMFIPLEVVKRLGIKYTETVTDDSGKEFEQEIEPEVSYFVEVDHEDISRMKNYVAGRERSYCAEKSITDESRIAEIVNDGIRSLERDILRYEGASQLVMKQNNAEYAGLDVSGRNKFSYVAMETQGLVKILEDNCVSDAVKFKDNVEDFLQLVKAIRFDEARIVYIMRNE